MSPQKLKQVIIKSINNYNLMKKVGIFASFLLVAFVSVYIYSPVQESEAATWTENAGTDPFSTSVGFLNPVELNITPTPDQKVYTADHNVVFSTTCPAGGTVYLESATAQTAFVETSNSNKKIAATTGSALVDNSWGYSINNGLNYYGIPAKGNAREIFTSSTETVSPFTVKYGVKTNYSTSGGVYTTSVVYTPVVDDDCLFYTVRFNPNWPVSGNMPALAAMEMPFGEPVSLFKIDGPSGYDFVGWKVAENGLSFTGDETAAHVNPGNLKEVTLVAQWHHDTDLFDITWIQDMTPLICDNTTTPNASATNLDWTRDHKGDKNYVPRRILKDKRDNKEYTVSKLADGNCWMSQNLGIDLSKDEPLLGKTTNLSTASWTPNSSTRTTLDFTAPSQDIGGTTLPGWTIKKSNNASYRSTTVIRYTNGVTPEDGTIIHGGDVYPYLWEDNGNYYDHDVAVTRSARAYSSLNPDPDEDRSSAYSICPSAWELPDEERTDRSYSNLLSVYGISTGTNSAANIAKLTSAPLNFLMSGRIHKEVEGGGWSGSGSGEWSSGTLGEESYNGSHLESGTIGYYYEVNNALKLDKTNNTVTILSTIEGNDNDDEYAIRCVNAKGYTIKLDEDGGSITPSGNVKVNTGTKVNLTQWTATKENSTFQGWYVPETNKYYKGTETAVDINPNNYAVVTLRALWDKYVWDYYPEYDKQRPDGQLFTAPRAGRYKIETWGAQGEASGSDDVEGPFGAYAAGEITLAQNAKLYVYVGTTSSSDRNGVYQGHNGGGLCYGRLSSWGTTYPGGGGATDVRTTQNNTYQNRLIVAAGGAGSTVPSTKHGGDKYGYGGDTTTKGPAYISNSVKPTNPYLDASGGAGGMCAVLDGLCSNGTNTCTNDVYDAFGTAGGGGGYEGGRAIQTKKYHNSEINNGSTPGWQNYYWVTGEGGLSYVGGVQNGQAIAGNALIFDWTDPSYQTKEIGNRGNGHARITYLGN